MFCINLAAGIMRIVYFHQYFSTPSSSSGIRSYEMARRLVAGGHKVDLISTSAFLEGQFQFHKGWNVLEIEGVNVHVLKLPYSNKLSFLLRIRVFMEFALRSALYACRMKADLIFATSTPLTIGFPAVIAARKLRVPLVFEVRDLWPDVPIALGVLKNPLLIWLAKRLELWTYRNSSRVIALSPGMAEGVRRRLNIPVDVIPNAADIDLFQQIDRSCYDMRQAHPELGDSKLLVYTGTIGLVNNIEYLVELASVFRELNTCLKVVVFGTGGEEGKIRSLAVSKDVWRKNFFIYPPVPKNFLPSILSEATLLFSTVLPVPALWDNSANKFFDALAAGRPIAINHEGWQADIIRNNFIGVVMGVGDPLAGAKAINEFVSDADGVSDAGRRAHELALAEFSRDILFAKFESVLALTLVDADVIE